MQPCEPKAANQLTPICEQNVSSGTSPVPADGLHARQHANRPSRLSAVLVPPVPSAQSPPQSPPPKSPPSSTTQARPAAQAKSSSCDVLCKEQQDSASGGLPAFMPPRSSSPRPAAAPAARAASPPPTAATAASLGAPASGGSKSAPAASKATAAPCAGPTSSAPPSNSGRLKHAISAALSPRSTADSNTDASEDDEGSDWGWDTTVPWYLRPRKVVMVLLLLASLGLVLAGLVLQVILRDPAGFNKDYEEVYPWMYFFAAFPPLGMALRWLCWRLYTVAEHSAIREELYFLRPLRNQLASLLFWMTILLWFQACFSWFWCQGLCEEEAYKKALLVVWRLLICITLFAAANFLKCSIARLLSYQFYRTAHFDKVKDAIERELYLIRLSQARSALLPPPAPDVAPYLDQLEQQDGLPRKAGAWGSTVWRKTSQIFLGQHAGSPAAHGLEDGVGNAGMAGGSAVVFSSQVPEGHTVPTAFATVATLAAAGAEQHASYQAGMRHVASADKIVEDAAVQVQVRQVSETLLKRQHPPHPHTAGNTAAVCTGDDNFPLLQQQVSSGPAPSPKVSWLQADLHKAQQKQSQQAPCQQQRQPQHAVQANIPGRQQSYELFSAERVPSILGMPPQGMQQHSSRSGSKAGSRAGSRVGQQMLRGRTGSKYSSSSVRRVSLPGMVAGVDGLLLQPEVLGATASGDGQATRRAGQPMTEEELSQLRSRLGVNTFGTFVDRYYGMTPKEEAAHVRQVKRFAKGLFANVLGDADRDHILPEDFLLFFDGDTDSAHDAFEYFDRNGDGSISCTELQESAAEMLCERKNIAASIKDTDSVVNSLEAGLGMLIHFIFIALYLLVWGVNIVQGFTTFSATALALTFIFGDSVKGVFESAVFLFVSHPYDVGDALWMNGMLARVKKIDLQFTVLLQTDGQLVWHPNNTLRTKPLVNLSRSNPRWEAYTCLVDIDTPDEVLTVLAQALAEHVATQPTHFSCNPRVTWRGMEDPLKLRLAVGVTYSFTGEDPARYVLARHGVLSVVRRELHKAGVQYTVPLQQQTLMRLQQPSPAAV